MGAATKLLEKKVLRDLIPLDALSAMHLEEISRKAFIEKVRAGRYVFKKGDRDGHSIYVIEGSIELLDEHRQVVGTIEAGSETARHPLAHKQPRQLSARAASAVTVARIDSSLLDVLLTWDESSGYDVVEIDADENEDWMTRVLRSQVFLQLPPSSLQQLLMRLEEISLNAGDAVVRQGEDGDYFYIVKSGRLAVSRKASQRSEEVIVAELGEGAFFGEEALVSESTRNASVTMITDGILMRLSKADFDELLRVPMVHEVPFEEANQLVARGAWWLDVRLPGEFENQALAGSRNLPLSALRENAAGLDVGVDYVVCCDTGRRSAAAAFVLARNGFNVYTLKNGLMDVPDGALTQGRKSGSVASQDQDADIIPFGPDAKNQQETAQRRDQKNESVTEARMASLSRQLEDARNELSEAKERLHGMGAQCTDGQLASNGLAHQIDAVGEQLQGALKERAQLERRLEQQRLDKASAEERAAEETRLRHDQQREHEKQTRLLEEELRRVRDECAQLGQRTNVLAGERDSAVAELSQLKEESAVLKERLGSLESESTRRSEALERSIDEREKAWTSERDELLGREQALQAQLQQARERAEEVLATARDEANAAQEVLHQRIAGFEAELESRQRTLERFDAERAELEKRLEKSQRSLEEAGERAQRTEQELGDTEQRLAENQRELQEARQHSRDLQQKLEELLKRQAESERHAAQLEKRLTETIGEHESDVASVRGALARAQDERENVKRDQKRLMETLRKTERKLERERQDHEAEIHRLRKELKQAAGESHAGLTAELEALQEKLKRDVCERDELEVKLGQRSAQLENLQSEADRLTAQLAQAQDAAGQAEQRLAEMEKAANEEFTIRLTAEQELQQALRDDLATILRERDDSRQQLALVTQEAVELREAVSAAQAQIQSLRKADHELDALHEALRRVEAERDSARDAEQRLREELGQLGAEGETSRALEQLATTEVRAAPIGVDAGEVRAAAAAESRQRETEEQLLALQDEVERLRAELSGVQTSESLEPERVMIETLDEADPFAGETTQSDSAEAPAGSDSVKVQPMPLGLEQPEAEFKGTPPVARKRLARGALAVFVLLLVAGPLLWLQGPSLDSLTGLLMSGAGLFTPPQSASEDMDQPTGETASRRISGPGRDSPVTGQPSSDEETATAGKTEPEAGRESGADREAEQALSPNEEDVSAAAGTTQPGNRFRDRLRSGGTGPSVIELYADSFRMGSGATSPHFDERPRHVVSVERFAISRHEITFEQYDRFAEATGRARPPSRVRGVRPVVKVSWHDAVAYAKWLSGQTGHSYRLPT
ncbi:MAG: cyclic nucleotide-binding domain-containing protein, partial [Gammaproteobacteria bacterium]